MNKMLHHYKKSRMRAILCRAMLLLLACTLSIASPLHAQSFYGSVVGTVTDVSGSVVPGATVTAVNIGTNESQTVQSDKDGNFSFVNLRPATYKVGVEKAGFKRYSREQLNVAVGSTSRVDAALQIGATSETVEVTTTAPLLPTDSSSLTQTISAEQVAQMPLNGRNIENLIGLAPGVVPTGASQGNTGLNQGTRTAGGAGYGNYQIGGAVQGWSAQYIDGVANNVLNGNTIALVPTQDAIQEFSVVSSNATADFGRFAGGVVNMTSKSGANALHGSAYEYIRNRDFNANDFFSNRNGLGRPEYTQNQFGGQVTGPIIRDKAFFMFTIERFVGLFGNLTPTNVPTVANQNGVFATTLNKDPLGICNIQPYTGQTVNGQTFASGGTYITNLYGPGLIAGTTCGDPTNKILKNYFAAPNATGASNFLLTTPLTNHQLQYNGRIDYTISPKQRIFGRYSYWSVRDTGHTEFNDKGFDGGSYPTSDGHNSIFTHQFVLGDTYSISPSTVLDVRLNYVRQTDPNNPDSTTVNESRFGSNYATLASQMYTHVLPGFQLSGSRSFYNLGNFPNLSINWWNTYGINANLVKIVGPHTFKFGAELRLMDQSGVGNLASASGGYTYTNAFTGDEFASLLLGYPTTIVFNTAASTAAYMHYQAYYVSDNWQVSHNLTLTLGLRYELPGAISERNNKATVLLPTAVDPTTGITGTLALVNSSLYGNRSTVVAQNNLFAPRVGFAYRLGENTVFQGGYGLSYLPNDLSGGTIPGNSPVNAANTQVNIPTAGNPLQLQTPLGCLAGSIAPSNPGCISAGIAKAGINQPVGRSNPAFTSVYGSKTQFLNKTISGPIPFQSIGYVQEWNVAISHQFKGDILLGAAYASLKGSNLPGIGSRNLNQLPDQYDSMGAALATTSACSNASALVLKAGQCLRPFPYYNNVTDSVAWYARQNYRSLQLKAEKRFGRGGTLSANFTTSKNMGNTDTQNGFLESKSTTQGGSGNGGVQDWNNLAAEYSLISYDVTNRTVINYVLPLPFGKGQKYASNYGGVVNALASGWAINGITIIQSGFPLFFSTTTQNQIQGSYGGGTTRPNVVPGCNKKVTGSGLSRANAGGWFNVACFSYAGDYAFGNEPRVDPDLRGDGIKNFDFAFQKATPIHERANLQFRAEFFNVFNRVQFAPPGTTVPVSAATPTVTPGAAGNGTFGAVTYQVNKPRQIQLSLRLGF